MVERVHICRVYSPSPRFGMAANTAAAAAAAIAAAGSTSNNYHDYLHPQEWQYRHSCHQHHYRQYHGNSLF
eukprot:3493985-Pleurochrysis_carterae.AAC.1